MRSVSSHKLAFSLMILSVVVAGCQFEESIDPLELQDLPPPMVFTDPGIEGQPPDLEVEEGEQLPIEPVEVEPEFEAFCTTDYLNLRDQPSTEGAEVVTMPPGSQLAWTGEQTVADGYTWYQVTYAGGEPGWAASDWLEAGDCGAIAGGPGGAIGLIAAVYTSGYHWLDKDSNPEHFGLDLQSRTGNTTISSPYADEVVVSDACSACTEADSDEGNTLGDTGIDYNFGYGAMTVVEYAYEDLSQAERTRLAKDGIDLEEGQSVYIMVAHMDPNETIAGAGTKLAGGSELANIGNSGNSDGAHSHVEVAVHDSGLRPSAGQPPSKFWLDTVVEQDRLSPYLDERQGNRVDPTALFD